MPITFDDVDDLLEFTTEYAALGRHVTDQLEALRSGERLPSDELSLDAIKFYIVPFLNNLLDRGISFPELPPAQTSEPFDYLFEAKLESFAVTVTVQMPAEDEHDNYGVEFRIRNALEAEGLNLYSDLKVTKA